MFPATRNTVMADKEKSPEAILNATAPPDVRTIFVQLLKEVKMNENFTNISYVDKDEPLLSSTDKNKDEAASDTEGIETASLDAQVVQLTAKQQDSDLLAAIAQDLDVRE